MQSQVLLAFVQAHLPQELRYGARTVADLAASAGIPEASMASLLRAASALDLSATVAPDQYRLGELGAVLVDNPGVVAMIIHHDALYHDLAEPLELLRTAGAGANLQRYWAYANSAKADDLDAADVTAYTQLMAASQEAVTEQVLTAIDLGDCRHLLDVGGGNASFAIAVARKWPQIRVTVADLPPVIASAQQNISVQGLNERIQTVAVDFKRQPLPDGHDAVSLVRILHDHDDADVRRLLESAAKSLPAEGLLLVAEPLAESTTSGRLLEAYFGMYLLAMGQGRLRRQDELSHMLEEAGFYAVHRARTSIPLISSVLSGRRNKQT